MMEPSTSKSLWPDLPKARKGPVAILREQAQWLKRDSNDSIDGLVAPLSFEWSGEDTQGKHSVGHLFFIRVPALDDYLYKLFSIRQSGTGHYPLQMHPNEEVLEGIAPGLAKAGLYVLGGGVRITNETELMAALKMVFAAGRTQEVISNLLGQIED